MLTFTNVPDRGKRQCQRLILKRLTHLLEDDPVMKLSSKEDPTTVLGHVMRFDFLAWMHEARIGERSVLQKSYGVLRVFTRKVDIRVWN